MEIRPETPQDIFAIRKLTEAAFAPMPYSDGSEAKIIDRLREEGNLTLSLVTADQDQVLAHIAFSPVTVERTRGNWCGLGPVSVAPSWQKQGIGTTLIGEGLSRMKKRGTAGCVLIGAPDFYQRFGFQSDPALSYGNVPRQFVQFLSFDGVIPIGAIRYRPAFEISSA